jgi:hypothetical protein
MSKHIVSDIRHGYGSRKAGTRCQETIFRDTVQMSAIARIFCRRRQGAQLKFTSPSRSFIPQQTNSVRKETKQKFGIICS